MKTAAKITVAGALLALLASCCTLNEYDSPCRSNQATIMAGAGQLQVTPECLYVDAGQAIKFKIKRAAGVGAVQISPKTGGINGPLNVKWLSATSENGEAIVLTAPKSEQDFSPCEDGVCEYQFQISVGGVGELDPRVRVRYAPN